MSSSLSALSFVEPGRAERLPVEFKHFLDRLGVEMHEPGASRLRMRAVTLKDWWFCWVEGGGSVRIVADRSSLVAADWDLLLYSARGFSKSLTPAPIVPSAGEFLLSRPSYAGDIVSQGPFGYLCVFIPGHHLDTIGRANLRYGHATNAHRGAGAVAGAALRALVANALDEDSSHSCAAVLPDVARLLFSVLGQAGAANDQTAPPEQRAARGRQFKRVMEHVQLHCRDPHLTVASTARACGLSERSIYRGFSELNHSFEGYLQRLRLENAATLLTSRTELSVTAIAYDCGFSSPSAFCRQFRRSYGSSPGIFSRQASAVSVG